MRSIGTFLSLLSASMLCGCAAAGAQQISPHRDIRWPPSCNQPNMAYNWYANTCVSVGSGIGGPYGADKQVTFNQSGTMVGNSGLLYDYTTGALKVGGTMPTNTVTAGPQSAVPASWIFDWTTPQAALNSISPSSSPSSATFSTVTAGSMHPATGPVYDVMNPTYGAKCDGVTDDTAALQAAMNAASGVSNVQAGIFYVPNNGKACLVSAPITFNNLNIPVLIHVEGTIRMTSATTGGVIEVTAYHPGGEALFSHIWGTGVIDANGMATSALWMHQCTKVFIDKLTFNRGTSYGIRVGDRSAGMTCIPAIRDATFLYEDLTVTPPGKSASVAGATAIYPDKASDMHVDNAECIGWDICVNSPGQSSKIMHSHCWGNSTQVPSTCFYGSVGGTFWLDDYADGPTVYGYHLTGLNDVIEGGMVYCNASFCPNNTVIGMQFDQAQPFATVTNSTFFGGTNNILQDVNVTGGDYSKMNFSGNTSNNTTNIQADDLRVTHSVYGFNVNAGNAVNGFTGIFSGYLQAPYFAGALHSYTTTFANTSGAPFVSCLAFSEAGTPSFSAGVVTFPTDGVHNGGSLYCTSSTGTITVQAIADTGASAQTFTMTNLGTGSAYTFNAAAVMALPTSTTVNGQNICLLNGTNCPPLFMTFLNIGTIGGTGTFDTHPALTQAITIDSVSAWVATAPVGCSTYPVINLWDSTAGSSLANVTLASGVNAYTLTVTSAAVATGHQLAYRVSTAPTGCTTSAANADLSTQYH